MVIILNKNILFVNLYPPYQNGGEEIQTYRLINLLKKKRFNPFILSMGDKKFYEKCSDNGVDVYRIDKFQKNRRHNFSILQGIRYLSIEIFNPFIFLYTIFLILKHRIEVVHISTFNQISLSPLIAAKILLRKVVVTLHSYELLCFFSMIPVNCYGVKEGRCGECMTKKHRVFFLETDGPFRKLLLSMVNYQIKSILFLKMKIVNHLADWIIFPSDNLRKFYVKYGLKDEKTRTVYNFMSFPKVDKSRINQIKKSLNIKNEKVILFVGALLEEKGINVLLKAFEKLSKQNLKLVIVGKTHFYDETKKFEVNPELSDKVIFTGWVEEADKPNYYDISDIVVIPSLILETFSLVFLEASLLKKLIISSNVGALSDEIIDGKNGFLVEPNNPDKLAEKIEYVLKNFDKLAFVRENAYSNAAENYEPNKIINQFIELYSEGNLKSKLTNKTQIKS